MLNKVLKLLVVLFAVLFVTMGLRWLVNPASIAPDFGFPLADGVGLSSQVGDMSAYFLTLGVCMLTALVSGQRTWYYPLVILLLLTAVGRTLAWLIHDAAFAVDKIGAEVIVALVLLAASRRLADSTD
jgi:Domain of unknown function (DUF4345)